MQISWWKWNLFYWFSIFMGFFTFNITNIKAGIFYHFWKTKFNVNLISKLKCWKTAKNLTNLSSSLFFLFYKSMSKLQKFNFLKILVCFYRNFNALYVLFFMAVFGSFLTIVSFFLIFIIIKLINLIRNEKFTDSHKYNISIRIFLTCI